MAGILYKKQTEANNIYFQKKNTLFFLLGF